MRILLFSFLGSIFLTSSAFAAKYELDKSHTSISFVVPHLTVSKVKGRFDKFDGSFDFDEKEMKLENVEITIRADSVNTNEKDRDKDLRSPNFLDVEKYPEIKFKSSKTIWENKKPKQIEGHLTIHGITKPATLEVNYPGSTVDPKGNEVLAFEAKTKINRQDFGLKWNKKLDKGGWVVGDEVKIEIEGEAKRK